VRADLDMSQTRDTHESKTRNQIRANEPKAKRMDAVVMRNQYRETNETKPTIGILGKIYGQ
jgi:phage antirepressor YoqD-like protein